MRFILLLCLLCGSISAQSLDTNSLPSVPPPGAITSTAPNLDCLGLRHQFYATEPGVYIYAGACNNGFPQFQDSAGNSPGSYGFVDPHGAFGVATINSVPGPFPNEGTALQFPDAIYGAKNQDTLVNSNGGAITTWVNADATDYPVTIAGFSPQPFTAGLKSVVSLFAVTQSGLCFGANWTNSAGGKSQVLQCGYVANTWHRVGMSWGSGNLILSVDGVVKQTTTTTGSLDLAHFYRQAGPACCHTGKQMSVGMITIADEAWPAAQFAADYGVNGTPDLASITPPLGGLLITARIEGIIHAELLGVAFEHPQSPYRTALIKGLTAAGVRSARYAPNGTGIIADMGDWHPGSLTSCNGKQPVVAPNAPVGTPGIVQPDYSSEGIGDTIDEQFPNVFIPLHIAVTVSVNYGTNPPICDAGGDPQVNGRDFLKYLNVTPHTYAVKRAEVGNEMWACSSPIDNHADNASFLNCYNGLSSYPKYEPAFYASIKAADPSVQVYVPMAPDAPEGQFDFYTAPVIQNGAFDGFAVHGYSVHPPITDANVIYPDRPGSNSAAWGYMRHAVTLAKVSGKTPNILYSEWGTEVGGNQWSQFHLSAAASMYGVLQLTSMARNGFVAAHLWAQGMSAVSQFNNAPASGLYLHSAPSIPAGSGALVYTGDAGYYNNDHAAEIGLKPGDLYPVGHAFELLSKSGFVTEGEHMLLSFPDQTLAPWLAGYGATHGSSFAVVLINKDYQPHLVPVSIAGMSSCSTATLWSYGAAQYAPTRFHDWSQGVVSSSAVCASGAIQQIMLPAFSSNVVVFQ